MNTNTRFIVQEAAAAMPSSCWGQYKRVAVLEIEADWPEDTVSMISERARGVVRVVRTWEKLRVGTTERSCYIQARREAGALAAYLNAVKNA